MCMPSSNAGAQAAQQAATDSANAAAQQRAQEQKREADIATGNTNIATAFAPFDDSFYSGRAKAYSDFANPQLDDQFKIASDDLKYQLGRQGILDSSEAARQTGELQKQHDLEQQNIVDTGQQYANTARTDVASQRSNLTNQLNASADPNSVAAQTGGVVTSLQSAPAFSPLTGLFSNITNLAANQQLYSQALALTGGNVGGAGASIFGASPGGSARTVA